MKKTWAGVDWINLGQVRDKLLALATTVKKYMGSMKCFNFVTSQGTVSFLGMTGFHGFT
jgi:hypothetical protein